MIEHFRNLANAVAAVVVDDNGGDEIDVSAEFDNASVEFIVLVADQFFVKIADFVKYFATEATEGHGIYLHFLVGADAEVRVAHAEGGTERSCDGLAHRRVLGWQGSAQSAHVVCVECVELIY